MKNPASYIREKLVILLNDTITYNGAVVSCYSGNGEVTAYQILIRDATDTNLSTRDSFSGRWTQVIEVISEQETSLHKHVDAIGNSVLSVLIPSPKISPLNGNSDFQIGVIRKEGQRYMDETSGEGTFINRLLITISFIITQI